MLRILSITHSIRGSTYKKSSRISGSSTLVDGKTSGNIVFSFKTRIIFYVALENSMSDKGERASFLSTDESLSTTCGWKRGREDWGT